MASMGEKLEHILKGMRSGLGRTWDVFGFIINQVDLQLTGIGPADTRSIPTVSSLIDRKALADTYTQTKRQATLKTIGMGLGVVAALSELAISGFSRCYFHHVAALTTYHLGAFTFTALSPTFLSAALLFPAAMGIYSLGAAVVKYTGNFVRGERRAGWYEKASFKDGFAFGWEKGTHFLGHIAHNYRSLVSGRGYTSSGIYSSIANAALPMRRNFSAVLGSALGQFTGTLANVLTLGYVGRSNNLRSMYAPMYSSQF